MPLPAPLAREPIHTRRISFQCFAREDGLWDLDAELTDVKDHPVTMFERGILPPGGWVHRMALRVTVDDDLVVRDILTAMDDTPLAECLEAAPPMRGLIGACLGRGWRKAIDRELGGPLGCAHLRELLMGLATAAYQSIPAGMQRHAGVAGPPPGKDGQPPLHVGRCKGWDVDGAAVARHYPEFVGWAPLRRVDRAEPVRAERAPSEPVA